MKKYAGPSFLILLLFPICLSAQQPPSEAEMQARMIKLQKQLDSMKNDPRVKKYLEQNSGTIPTLPTAGASGTKPVKPSTAIKETGSLPAPDTAKIRSLPRGSMSLPELNSYLVNLRLQLSKRLPADAVSSADAIARKLNYDPAKLDAAALQAWEKGATEEAVLLATDAATRNNGDGLLLTNTGAILDMSGLSEKAIPILRTIVRYDPNNAIALNNLGQAYTQLGMHDSGMIYLKRCLSLSSKHPEANNTAGQIELKKGNKGKAKEYFENSIKGSYTVRAYKGLRNADPNARIRKFVKDRVKVPEYLNKHKYDLPRQCYKTEEAKSLEEEYKQYKLFLGKQREKYNKLRKEAEQQYAKEGFKKLQEKAMNPKGNIVKPFMALGGTMLSETTLDWSEELMKLEKYNAENRKTYKSLEKEYEAAYKKLTDEMDKRVDECCGEGNTSCCFNDADCKAVNELANKYLFKFAQFNEEWQKHNLQLYKDYFDELIFWSYLGSMDNDEFKIKFYDWIDKYLIMLQQLCQTKLIYGCQPEDADKPEPVVAGELKQYECPIEFEMPFLVGKLSIDCEKFSFSAGELVTFKYEKNFIGQRQSTMSLGIGAGIYLLKVPGAPAGVEVSAGMSVYLSFDNMGHLTDGGLQTGAKASAGIEFEAGERLKLKKEMKKEAGVGWRVGIASGINFDEGPLKGILNPKENPVNRNVNVYTPR
jgi:Flp pilus assembly protein TadD